MGAAEESQVVALEGPSEAPALAPARVVGLEGATPLLQIGRTTVRGVLDPSVHPAVIATAIAREERVIVAREEGEWVVLGVLRTSPTPGIEEAEEYVIRAGRIRMRAGDELTMASGKASIAVRAYGAVETLAEQITSRASAIHKIVGRMLHLN